MAMEVEMANAEYTATNRTALAKHPARRSAGLFQGLVFALAFGFTAAIVLGVVS